MKYYLCQKCGVLRVLDQASEDWNALCICGAMFIEITKEIYDSYFMLSIHTRLSKFDKLSKKKWCQYRNQMRFHILWLRFKATWNYLKR